jgi:hypothetical protein
MNVPELASASRRQSRDWLAWCIDRILVLWNLPILDNKLFLAGFAAVLFGVCLARAYAGIARIEAYPWDTFSFLDGAWRIANKQIPYRDYFESLGPIIFIQTRLGLLLAHGSVAGFAYSHAVVSAMLGLWSYALSARRLPHTPRVLLCASLVLLAVSPFMVGEAPNKTTAACIHNRYGYVLTALVLVEAFYASKHASRWSEFRGGFSTGTALALALFVKVSYFLGIGLLLIGLFWCRRQTLRRWTGIAAGFGSVFIAFWAFLGYTLAPMWNDMRAIGGAKHIQFQWPAIDAAYQGIAPFLVFVFLAVALLWSEGARDMARNAGILGLAASALGLFYLVTNSQGDRLPLNAVASVLVVQAVSSGFAAAASSQRVARCTLVLWTAFFVFSQAALDLAGTAYAVEGRLRVAGSSLEPFHSPRLAGFRARDGDYVKFVNGGLDLLGKYRQQNDTVMTLDFSNPFPFALGIPPAPGGVTCLKYRYTFDDTHSPSAERCFGQASLVMLPKKFTDYTMTQVIARLYGPYLADRFHLIGETEHWQLFRHND